MKVTLVGNPNCGKTSLFNRLTGLNQRVGNYPGITVDKRTGKYNYKNETTEVTDLPGIYSLFPGSKDEQVSVETLLSYQKTEAPVLLCVIDITSVQKNLLLLSQLVDFGLPIIGVLNYRKNSSNKEKEHWLKQLKQRYNIPWVAVNAGNGEGVENLKELVNSSATISQNNSENSTYLQFVENNFNDSKKYATKAAEDLRNRLQEIDELPNFETTANSTNSTKENLKKNLDKWIMHPIWGYAIFLILITLVFQAVFSWAAYPMDLIDAGFAWLSEFTASSLPNNFLTNAITQGIIPGLGGVVIFIPQIAFLFLFIALFEESGYMTRVVFLMDRLVKPFGLSGRSVVPLISGFACAIPAIMASRTIKHPRERLITMLVIPFTTCSARIPVYTTLIALLVASEISWGPFNAQGLILLAMYAFGAFISFVAAWVINKIMKGNGRSLLVMELPEYKIPNLKNTTLTVYEKSKSFVLQAGKVILMVSLVLYFMANIGFTDTFNKVNNNNPAFTEKYTEQELAKLKLEHSLIGQTGKAIEPVIKPLGYDWKIGISLITSFAAREVFVGTLSTIYALEDQGDDTSSIIEHMRKETDENGQPLYSIAVILSLLVFYALAMQCLSTVAVMVKESGGWKWASIQLFMASGVAYLFAFVVYQALR